MFQLISKTPAGVGVEYIISDGSRSVTFVNFLRRQEAAADETAAEIADIINGTRTLPDCPRLQARHSWRVLNLSDPSGRRVVSWKIHSRDRRTNPTPGIEFDDIATAARFLQVVDPASVQCLGHNP